MVKYFCDRCGNEMSTYEYDNACNVTISSEDVNDGLTIYKLCSNCEFAVRHFIKENKSKVKNNESVM